jgi:hypothetical protein
MSSRPAFGRDHQILETHPNVSIETPRASLRNNQARRDPGPFSKLLPCVNYPHMADPRQSAIGKSLEETHPRLSL